MFCADLLLSMGLGIFECGIVSSSGKFRFRWNELDNNLWSYYSTNTTVFFICREKCKIVSNIYFAASANIFGLVMFSFTFIFSKLFYPQPTHKRAAGLSQTIACEGRTEEEVWKHQRPVYCILGHYTGTQTPNDFGGENGLLTSEARGGLWTNGNVTINNGNDVLFV